MSRVFIAPDAVLRGFRGDGVTDLEALEASEFFTRAVERGELIDTERVEPDALGADWQAAVRHRRLPVISYPYEWTFSMLQDAALLQLKLAREALADGLLCKDATPYNIQFDGVSPTFIDIGSFEAIRRGEPWRGYRQFCELFLNPLLLQARLDVGFQPWLRGSIDGIAPTELAPMLSRWNRLRPGTLSHVTMHARADRRHAAAGIGAPTKQTGVGPALIDAQMKNLTKAVERLRWKRADSTWSTYSDRQHYTDTDLEAKERFVASVTGRTPRELVWDLGANDGRFSRIAADSSETVIAVDMDALVVDRLYRELRADGEKRIVPLVMDLIDSSPGLGWRSMERTAFYERTRPDVVLALALVHHLAIPGMVPPEHIVDWLAAMDAEIVVEIPHVDDPMVQVLLANKRAGVFDHYHQDAFDRLLRARLDVRTAEVLPGGTRTLYHAAPGARG